MRPPALVVPLFLVAACGSPRADASAADPIGQAANAISSLQQDQDDLQNQIDSLRRVVAHQDTLITRLAQQVNLPMPVR